MYILYLLFIINKTSNVLILLTSILILVTIALSLSVNLLNTANPPIVSANVQSAAA
jgi:hypothetical protein